MVIFPDWRVEVPDIVQLFFFFFSYAGQCRDNAVLSLEHVPRGGGVFCSADFPPETVQRLVLNESICGQQVR